MDELNKNDMIDLGSDPVGEEFDPFSEDEAGDGAQADSAFSEEPVAEVPATAVQAEASTEAPALVLSPADTSVDSDTKAAKPKAETKEPDTATFSDKQPVFEYAGATENIDDTSKTFDELRIEKAADFPELEDGKRVSWAVEYGKITKTVADPKGTSIGKMKSDIETSKEFEDSLKKRGADKNPSCKVKPRVTAQSKGQAAYKGVFPTVEEAEASGKVISIVPARDGKVYEIRNTEVGRFITPTAGSELLSDVRAGFIPALPPVPMSVMTRIVTLFRHYARQGNELEALVNLYFDKIDRAFIIDVPEQTVTKVSVNSNTNDTYTSDRYIHYMDIHSHNSMKAFFSGTDDNDERATRLYSVIGHMDKYFPDIKTRFSNGGKFMEIDPALVFEHISSPIPDEWKERVRFEEGNYEICSGKAC